MKQLTQQQRYHIYALRKTDHSQGQIAEQVGCSKSTVSRELQRNCDRRDGSYWPDLAQRKTNARHKAKAKRKRFTASVQAHVTEKLKEDYSPEQIVGDAARKGIECVSHERIYQLFGTTRGRAAGCTATCATRASAITKGGVRRAKGAKL